jgi:hypothetical protein
MTGVARKEIAKMSKRSHVLALVPALLLVSAVPQAQQGQQQYPLMDMIAQKVIDKYNNMTCVQLAEMKSEKPQGERAEMEKRAIAALKADPKMRQAFLDKVAGPIANKMFQCGMIP